MCKINISTRDKRREDGRNWISISHSSHQGEIQEPVEIIIEKDSHKRKPTWPRELIWEATRYGTPEGVLREKRRAKPYNSYVSTIWLISQ